MKRITTAVLILTTASGVYAQGGTEAAEKTHAESAEISAAEAQRVVARLRDRNLTWADLEPDPRMVEINRKAFDAPSFEMWMEDARSRQLTGIIFGELFEAYRKERGIEVTEADLDEFIEGSERMEAESRRGFRERAAAIPKQLESTVLPEAERKRLTEELAMLDRLIQSEEEAQASMREQWGEEWEKVQRESRARIGRHMIEAWKTNRALYEEFGGRVIFQQAGPEPVDAYRDFLRQHEAAGTFEIGDEDLKEDFWRYFVNDAMHVFYDNEEGAKWMARPWWQREAGETGAAP